MQGHYTYILRSRSNPARHYTGSTSNLRVRLRDHNAGLQAATARHRPWRLIVALWFPNKATAESFERYLKTGSGRAFAKRHFGDVQQQR